MSKSNESDKLIWSINVNMVNIKTLYAPFEQNLMMMAIFKEIPHKQWEHKKLSQYSRTHEVVSTKEEIN